MTKQITETRKFKMHPDLLFSVIKAQAGTAEKAILEAVMNAVDAGATKCEINIDSKGYTISDDGKGFASRQEIDEFFETFGTPHKEGDATYGRFRMGRGQLFAFSATKWRTSTFEMNVNIQKLGLDYSFTENLPNEVGCTIHGKWYDKLTTQDLFNVTKELEKLIKYMQIPVLVNGKNFSLEVDKQNWDYSSDDFYVKVNRQSTTLSVYNMGALVSHYPASKFGVGGTVVTRSALQVNFARNDVLVSQCQLWKKIEKKMREIMGIETAKKNVLTDSERSSMLDNILSKELLLSDVFTKGLIVDISNKKINFKSLISSTSITFSTGNWKFKKAEERINDSKICLVLHEDMLDKFNVSTPKDFVEKVQSLITHNNLHINKQIEQARLKKQYSHDFYPKILHSKFNPKILDVNSLIKSMNLISEQKSDTKYTKKEKAFVAALSAMSQEISYALYSFSTHRNNEDYKWEDSKKHVRRIILGKSEVANAWTDGVSYIAFNENLITKNPMQILNIMVHEYCHNHDTMETHDHGVDFYQLYHDFLTSGNQSIDSALLKYQSTFNKEMLKLGIQPQRTRDESIEILETNEAVRAQLTV